MRVIHAYYYTQILLDPWYEKFEQSSAFVLISHLFLELREYRLKLLGSIKTWDFSGGYKWIKVFKEFSFDYMVILYKQAYLLRLNTSLLQNNFKISLEFFHSILSIDIRWKEAHVEHISD